MCNKKDVDSCKDPTLAKFCSVRDKKNKENHVCRRKVLLEGLGSRESVSIPPEACCDSCSNGKLPPALDLVQRKGKPRKRKQAPVRAPSADQLKELRARLLSERDRIVAGDDGLRMLGRDVVCPAKVVDEICAHLSDNAISSVSHMLSIKGLRHSLHSSFFNVIMDTL